MDDMLPSEDMGMGMEDLDLSDQKKLVYVSDTDVDDEVQGIGRIKKFENPLVSPAPRSQWLLVRQELGSNFQFQFLHPVYPCERYERNIFNEDQVCAQTRVLHSKDGWVLMSFKNRKILFISPFPNKNIIKLPDLTCFSFDPPGVTFTCTPLLSSCVVFVISTSPLHRSSRCRHVQIATCTTKEWKWKTRVYSNNNIPFIPAHTNPVFVRDKFYCLSKERHLGVYDHIEDTWTILWTILEEPLRPNNWLADEHYLVEHEGGLMSVCMRDHRSRVFVFKLNESDMAWEDVQCLGDYALFLSIPTAFATTRVLGMMKNKIFFPSLHNDSLIFYCLETKTFRTFGSNLCAEDVNSLNGTEIPAQLESCWMEPNEIYINGR